MIKFIKRVLTAIVKALGALVVVIFSEPVPRPIKAEVRDLLVERYKKDLAEKKAELWEVENSLSWHVHGGYAAKQAKIDAIRREIYTLEHKLTRAMTAPTIDLVEPKAEAMAGA